jgi:hypothetical protein
MAQLYSFKLRGLTAADATIATKTVSYDSDGFLRWTDANSIARRVPISGDLAELLREVFTGTGGIDAGTTNVQGHRPFGSPRLAQ